MDSTSAKTEKPKLEELSREQLIGLLKESIRTKLMKAAGLSSSDDSVLDQIYPNKGKPLPAAT